MLPCMLLCCCMRARAYGLCARVHVAAGRHPAAMGWLWDTLYSRSEPHHSQLSILAIQLCEVTSLRPEAEP